MSEYNPKVWVNSVVDHHVPMTILIWKVHPESLDRQIDL